MEYMATCALNMGIGDWDPSLSRKISGLSLVYLDAVRYVFMLKFISMYYVCTFTLRLHFTPV